MWAQTKRNKAMKQIFQLLIPVLILGALVSYDAIAKDGRRAKKRIILTTVLKDRDKIVNRDFGPDADATYYPDTDIIELACEGTKETSVYIVNSKGEEISYDSFDAGMNPYYMMDVPQTPGTYYIIIDSPVLYAEGAFVAE